MYIKNINLINFRNYEKLTISFNKGLNIIIGNNAQGKTNLIESIYLSGFGKSFRTSKDNDLIKINEKFLYSKLNFIKNEREQNIEFTIKGNRKKEIKINGRNILKLSEVLGNINVVIFSPDDLKLIKDSPSERRKFIDRELSQMSTIYYKKLVEYNKILNQRNNLLRKIIFNEKLKDTLEVWDLKLADVGSDIVYRRYEFICKLDKISNKIHKKISDGKENLVMKYISGVKCKNFNDKDEIKKNFFENLINNYEKDINRGFTSVGPHRDDISLFVNDINIKKFGSQGQQRTAVLSLKLSEIELIYSETGEYPILLLDDVMSELDINRQNDLLYMIDDVQTIITTTDVNNINVKNIKLSTIFKVNNGKIEKK